MFRTTSLRLFCLVAAIGFCSLSTFAGDLINLYHYKFDVTEGEPAIPSDLRFDESSRSTNHVYKILHFNEKMKPALRQHLEGRQIEIINYIPTNAFLVRLAPNAQLDNISFVDWAGDYHPAYKIHPEIGNRTFTSAERTALGFVLVINLHPGSQMSLNRRLIENLGGEILDQLEAYQINRFEVRFPNANAVPDLARITDVAWISEMGERAYRNERARWIIQSYDDPGNVTMATPAYDAGLRGEDEIVGVLDGNVDLNHCFFEDTSGAPVGPTHRKVQFYNIVGGVDSHGTHVAGSVLGIPEDGNMQEAGMAYNARLAFSTGPGNRSGNLLNLFETHASEGARVHTNSWGETFRTDYSVDCVDIDTFMYNNEDNLVMFATMNGGQGSTPLLAPENAINVLAVGATEGERVANPHSLADRHGSSRIGPTVIDGRRKPEIFSPGCNIYSASVFSACGFNASCGTSMATPITAGAAAIVRQYFREGFYPTGARVAGDSLIPSGALLKAVMLNGTVNMLEETGNSAPFTDVPIPNDTEGWGRTNLSNSLFFDGDALKLKVVDVRNADGLSTGETGTHSAQVTDTSQPLRITMVFTGPPAAENTTTPVINDLNLRVTSPTGTVYIGNDWANGSSTTGGTADAINNVEQVLIPTPEMGSYNVEVLGTTVNMGTQGYALSMTGAITAAACAINIDSPNYNVDCPGGDVNLNPMVSGAPVTTVSWMPTTGLSASDVLNPTASPAQTTTYTVTVNEGQACEASMEITVNVPAMDFDGNSMLNQDDLLGLIGEEIWATPVTIPTMGRDFNGDGFINILDYGNFMNCLP